MIALKDQLAKLFETDSTSGVRLGILKSSMHNFTQSRGSEAAASIAYYAFFSLFPLLLVVITLGSSLIDSPRIVQQIIDWSGEAIPVSPEIITRNIETVLEQRGTVGLIGLVGLLWSGTNVFSILSLNINRSFPGAKRRNFLQHRLSGLLMVVVLTLFIFLSFFMRALLSFLPVIDFPLIGQINLRSSPVWTVISGFAPFGITLIVFLSLYRLIPRTNVRWSHVFWGALVAASGWEILNGGFTWYLGSGVAQYELVYGSLGAVVAFMFYIYWSGWILLFGAHLSAAIKNHRENKLQ
jgi:membrane protein